MKFLVIVAFIAIVACVNADYPKEPNEEHNKIIAECLTKFKMTDEEYTKLRRGELKTKPDENMRCMVNCFMETAGALKDGAIQLDTVSKILQERVSEAKAKTILEACRGESGPEKCETAYKLHECFLKNEAY